MLALDGEIPVYLHLGVTDMRSGFDRLAEKVRVELGRSLLSGGLFVFFNRDRSRVKIAYWDGDGFALWYKRLEAGVFRVERRGSGYEEITVVLQKLVAIW